MSTTETSPQTGTEPVRIARLIARLNVGGPAIHVILLTQYLKKYGYETTLVSGVEADHEGDMLHLARERDVTPIRIPELGRALNPVRDIFTLVKLCKLLRQIRPHIVHTHTAKAGTLGRIAAWLTGTPVIIHTFHGHVLSGHYSKWLTGFYRIVERFLARHSTRIISVSGKCRQDLLDLGIGDERKMLRIPLGLELERFPIDVEKHRGKLRARLGLGDDAPLIAIVARLVPIKRHDIFLKAAAIVHKRFPEARFLIVGDGETRGRMEELARDLGVQEAVIWMGFVEDPAEIYADADISALTSDDEGLPVAVIESLSSGRAVVATRVGGVPELVEEGVSGYLAERGDAEDFARALALALEDIERTRKMGATAQQRILKEISISRLAADLDRLYRECLQEVRT